MSYSIWRNYINTYIDVDDCGEKVQFKYMETTTKRLLKYGLPLL